MGRKLIRKKSITLYGKGEEGFFSRKFHIKAMTDAEGKRSSGGSVLCYEAYYEGSGVGILKEFYPADALGLARAENGVDLLCSSVVEAERAEYLRRRHSFEGVYRQIMQLRRENPEVETFVPACEIYYGVDESGKPNAETGAVYVWTDGRPVQTFASFCKGQCEDRGANPVKRLDALLEAVTQLADCVRILHAAGLLHRDIKPENFGYMRRGGKLLAEHIELFDLDSVCPVGEQAGAMVGTPGYLWPGEVQPSPAGRMDVFSIGAVLLFALGNNPQEKIKNEAQNRNYYQKLSGRKREELVKNSVWLQNVGMEKSPKRAALRRKLVEILQRSLCCGKGQYIRCEELLEDLRQAKVLLGALRPAAHNPAEAIQCELYTHPLYRSCTGKEGAIRLLVLGMDRYAEEFLDQSLQVCQVYGHSLKVTVACQNDAERAAYLKKRPALAEFFNVDGSLAKAGPEASYGTVNFVPLPFLRKGTQVAKQELENWLLEYFIDESIPQNIFVSVGEDAANRQLACLCWETIQLHDDAAVAGYAVRYVQRSTMTEEQSETLRPILVNSTRMERTAKRELQRMAANAHMLWEKNLNFDGENLTGYYTTASLANVLSIKYKLWSVGIDLDELGFAAAAEKTAALLKKDADVYKQLVWLEHRRWVAEKICNGWTNWPVSECGGKNKDEENRRHICILPSGMEHDLPEAVAAYGENAVWETNKEKSKCWDMLDALDQMSIAYHQQFAKAAKSFELKSAGTEARRVRAAIAENHALSALFEEWLVLLGEIKEGNSRQYARCAAMLKTLREDAALYLEKEDCLREITEILDGWKTGISPLIEYCKRDDFKAKDVDQVQGIPFILTYNSRLCMAVPYNADSPEENFDNTVAVLAAPPQTLLYLYYVEEKRDFALLERSIGVVAQLLRKKKIRSVPELLVLNASDLEAEAVERRVQAACQNWLHKVMCVKVEGKQQIGAQVEKALAAYQKQQVVALQKNASGMSFLLEGTGLAQRWNGFVCNECTLGFSGTPLLRYAQGRCKLQAEDLLSFRGGRCLDMEHPQYFRSYHSLWKIYNNDSRAWKELCSRVIKSCEPGSQDARNFISIKGGKELARLQAAKLNGLLHVSVQKGQKQEALNALLSILKKYDLVREKKRTIIGEDLETYDATYCYDLEIADENKAALTELLKPDGDAMRKPGLVECFYRSDMKQCVLAQKNLTFTITLENGGSARYIKNIIEALKGANYLQNVKYHDNKATFTCADESIRDLLMQEGKILEIYLYHSLRASGLFDDVVTSMEVDLGSTAGGRGINNEFDLLCVAGMQTVFIEAKAKSNLSPENYYKLDSLVNAIGIHATPVLVRHRDKPGDAVRQAVAGSDKECIARGNALGIKTFTSKWKGNEWDNSEVENLAEQLNKLLHR